MSLFNDIFGTNALPPITLLFVIHHVSALHQLWSSTAFSDAVLTQARRH